MVDHKIDRELIGCSGDRSGVSQSIIQSVSQPIRAMVDRSVGRSIGQAACRSNSQQAALPPVGRNTYACNAHTFSATINKEIRHPADSVPGSTLTSSLHTFAGFWPGRTSRLAWKAHPTRIFFSSFQAVCPALILVPSTDKSKIKTPAEGVLVPLGLPGAFLRQLAVPLLVRHRHDQHVPRNKAALSN